MRIISKLWRTLLFGACFAAGGLLQSPAQAVAASAGTGGKPESAVRMEEVVVTATRNWESLQEAPAQVTVIDRAAIERSGATTVVELLERLEGVNIRSYSGNPAQAAIDLRGFGGDNPFGKTLVLLDGRRLNRPDMASVNWLQIPLSNVERIEVMRGTASVLYGDSAVAGVIHVITRKGTGLPRVQAEVLAGSYGMHDERVGVSGSGKGFSVALSAENQRNGGYRDRSAFEAQSAAVHAGYDLGESFHVSVGGSFIHARYQLPGYLTREEMSQNRQQFQPARPNGWGGVDPARNDDDAAEKYGNADLRLRADFRDLGRVDLGLQYGSKEIAFNWYAVTDTRIDTFAVTPQYVLERPVFDRDNKLTVGIDWYHEPFRMERYEDRQRRMKSGTADLRRDTIGAYLRDEFALADRWILGAGFRKEQARIQGRETDAATGTVSFDDGRTHDGEAFEGSLTFLLGERGKLYGKWAGFYRIPFLDEQASYQGWGNSFNADLDKEKGASVEAGAVLHPLDRLQVRIALYRIDMQDEIAWNNATLRNENLDRTRHEGIEFGFSWTPRAWFSLSGNYTYQQASFTSGAYDGKTIPLVPRHRANLAADIRLPYDLRLRPRLLAADGAYLGGDYDNANPERLDGYTLFDLFLHYEPAKPLIRGVSLKAFVGVENLTGAEYCTVAYAGSWGSPNAYYPAPKQVYKCGVQWTF